MEISNTVVFDAAQTKSARSLRQARAQPAADGCTVSGFGLEMISWLAEAVVN